VRLYVEMTNVKEQSMHIRFFKLDKTATQTYKMLKIAIRKETENRTQTYDWFSKYRSGVMRVNSAECSGCTFSRKMSENTAQLKEIFRENRCVTIHDLAD
jgi:hypothetical protein